MKCLFDQWYDGDIKNLNNFTVKLFEVFLIADGSNRQKFVTGWPEYFEGSKNL